MRKGFTIIELLTASLLLAMLVTVLTMLFNQSSIAWRTGEAGIADLDDVRDNMAEIREEADNAFVCNGEVRRLTGLWAEDGSLFDRACDAPGSVPNSESSGRLKANILEKYRGSLTQKGASRQLWSSAQNMVSVGQQGAVGSKKNYTVNVKSAGPDREFNTWDEIWSWPDDFD